MALIDTQQTMDAYFRDLLNRGDYSRHYSDDVVVEVRDFDCEGHDADELEQAADGNQMVRSIYE